MKLSGGWRAAAAAASVVVLVGCGAGGGGFGADARNPLGRQEQFDAYFKGRRLSQHPIEAESLGRLFGPKISEREGLDCQEFREQVAGSRHYATYVKDPAGKLIAVGAEFRSGAKQFSLVGSSCEVFAGRMWTSLAGAEPIFELRQEAAGDHMIATFQKGGVKGSWRKETGTGDFILPHAIVDRVSITLQ